MRVKGGQERKRHKKVLKKAKGYRLSRSRIFRRANESVLHSYQYSRNNRRQRASQMRQIWIMRINASLRPLEVKYKDLIKALKDNKIEINRKMLAALAVDRPESFKSIVKSAGLIK